jgi:hypothetical protein
VSEWECGQRGCVVDGRRCCLSDSFGKSEKKGNGSQWRPGSGCKRTEGGG